MYVGCLCKMKYNTYKGESMFKVEKPEFVNKTFRIERSLLNRLEKVAQSEDVSVNALVVQCCNYALNDMEKKRE